MITASVYQPARVDNHCSGNTLSDIKLFVIANNIFYFIIYLFFGDVSFHFRDVGRCNVVFSHQNLTKNM